MPSILFVEDNLLTRRTLAQFLRLSGYDVYEAEDGETAVRLLSSMQFDFVISDLNLPGQLNGIDVLDASKRIPQKIDAVLITGAGSDEVKETVASIGADYMEKPVELEELARTIARRLRR